MRLKDKVAIVTGTSSGIGIGIAEVFAEEGAKVVCVARREKEGEAAAQSLRDGGAETLFIQGDVSKKVQVDEMVQRTLDTFGRIDVLVNNAGVDSVKAFEELSVEPGTGSSVSICEARFCVPKPASASSWRRDRAM